jgi:hypothetical protein
MLIESGSLNFTIPFFLNENGEEVVRTQGYLNDVEYSTYTGYTEFTGLTYYNAIGLSRVSELKKYGTNEYNNVTINDDITGYTIDNIFYQDLPEGYTILTGNTVGFTKEEVTFEVLSRNEHFLGFLDEPKIYSDVFIERGKQSVMELNLRLGEVNNMGDLVNYQNGFFKINKQ